MRLTSHSALLLLLSLISLGSGCSSLDICGHIEAVPANRVPRELLGRPRSEMIEISLSRLRQTPPEHYQLASGDILGIYIEGVLGTEYAAPLTESGLAQIVGPIVEVPEEADGPLLIGSPVPVQENGNIVLPIVAPINVEGLTIEQVSELIRRAFYVDRQVFPAGELRTIQVTIYKERTYQVMVIREETGGVENVTKRGSADTLELKAYENDLLHALNETGGLPGLDAKNEVLIIRGLGADGACYDEVVAMIRSCRRPCSCPPEIPLPPNVTLIPLRFYPDEAPRFTEEDIILDDGDIVLIESRDSERFYTGGVLGGGEFPIPRDYDLDILGAIAVAGGPVGSSGAVLSQSGLGNNRGGGGSFGRGGGGGGGGPLPPSEAIIVRKLCDGGQIAIKVDLNRALEDPSQRILIMPEDTIILKYTCAEETVNTVLGMLQFNFLYGLGGRGI